MNPSFTHAITRKPAATFAGGLTTSTLGAPDYDTMLAQHKAYGAALRSLGLEVIVLEPLPEFPDAHFVEDVAVIVPEVAVITRPGAPARRGEIEHIETALQPHRPIVRLQAPATLEGGDVLIVGKQVFVGISERTNAEGVAQLGEVLLPYGYTTTGIAVGAGLHLKSSLNWAGGSTLLVTPPLAGRAELAPYRQVLVDEEESYAANTLWVNGALLTPAGFPRLRAQLETLGLPVIEIEISEAQKMDGGLTCLSLRF